MKAASLLCVLLLVLAGCDWIGDPWVSGPEQLADERNRSAEMTDQLIDRAERGQTDR
jgi:hypothetical protein